MISSLQNPTVKHLAKLQNSSRYRQEQSCFLIEGPRALSRALSNHWKIQEVFYCSELLSEEASELMSELRKKTFPLTETSAKVFEKIAYRNNPSGILAVAPTPMTEINQLQLSEKALILVAEGIEKPGNIGSLLRIADAAGIDALILCDLKTDLFNPNVVRSSTGTLFSVPIITCDSQTAITWLEDKNISIITTSPDNSTEYSSIDYRSPSAIIIGSEQAGLSESWMKKSDQSAIIPMHGTADSLNAAISAGIILFEAVRQRRSF